MDRVNDCLHEKKNNEKNGISAVDPSNLRLLISSLVQAALSF